MDTLPKDLSNIVNDYKQQIETFEAHNKKMNACLKWISRLEIKNKTHETCNIWTTIKMFRSSDSSKSLYFYSVSSWCKCCGDKVMTDFFDVINESQHYCICEHFHDEVMSDISIDFYISSA